MDSWVLTLILERNCLENPRNHAYRQIINISALFLVTTLLRCFAWVVRKQCDVTYILHMCVYDQNELYDAERNLLAIANLFFCDIDNLIFQLFEIRVKFVMI